MDRTFVGDICFVRVRKTDLLEQESVRISPDFVCVDTPFWMDHGTCCEHSSCISVGERRASFSPYGFKKKRIIQQYLQLNNPTALILSDYTWKYKYRLQSVLPNCCWGNTHKSLCLMLGLHFSSAFALPCREKC